MVADCIRAAREATNGKRVAFERAFNILCYAVALPGRESGFRAGFRQGKPSLGFPAGLRPAGVPMLRLS
jgi:hypothetical protein